MNKNNRFMNMYTKVASIKEKEEKHNGSKEEITYLCRIEGAGRRA